MSGLMGVCSSRIMSLIGHAAGFPDVGHGDDAGPVTFGAGVADMIQNQRAQEQQPVNAAEAADAISTASTLGGTDANSDEESEPDLRSLDSLVSTHIHFKNRSSVPVKLFWINYDGDEVPYRTLQAGQSCRQQTFVTHPWTFKSVSHTGKPVACNKLTVVFPTSAELVVQIEHPTALEWTIDNHQRKFPLAFKVMVVAMMQCHYRCQQQGSEYEHSAAIALRSAAMALEPECGNTSFSGRSNSPATQDDMDYETAPAQTNLGDLPKDLIFEIIARAAPYVPDIRRMSNEEVAERQRSGAD